MLISAKSSLIGVETFSRSSVVKEDIVVFMSEPLMILVAGPYRSGTNDDHGAD
jgi:hypothetical protein